jgi:hypothetical protein
MGRFARNILDVPRQSERQKEGNTMTDHRTIALTARARIRLLLDAAERRHAAYAARARLSALIG